MFGLLFTLACAPPDAPGDDSATDETDDTAPVTYDTYACGWEKRDPGTLQATGAAQGDVLANLELMDQCGETFRVWDMYAEYFILFVTAAW